MKRTLYAVLFLLSSALPSLGQISGTTAGIVPFGSYMPVEAGTVNLANLNILFEIPIRNKPGVFVGNLAMNEVLWSRTYGTSPYWLGPAGGANWDFESTVGGGAIGTPLEEYKVAETPTTPPIQIFTLRRVMALYIPSTA